VLIEFKQKKFFCIDLNLKNTNAQLIGLCISKNEEKKSGREHNNAFVYLQRHKNCVGGRERSECLCGCGYIA